MSGGGEDGQQVYIQIGGATVSQQAAQVVMTALTPQVEEESPVAGETITPEDEGLGIVKQVCVCDGLIFYCLFVL